MSAQDSQQHRQVHEDQICRLPFLPLILTDTFVPCLHCFFSFLCSSHHSIILSMSIPLCITVSS